MNNGPEHTNLGREFGAAADGSGAPDHALEAALRRALLPADLPPGFTDRVLARAYAGERPANVQVAAPQKGKLLHWPQSRLWITGVVAAALVAGIFEGGVTLEHLREQRRKIVQATQQFQTTERITVHALAQAREQLQRAGVQLAVDE